MLRQLKIQKFRSWITKINSTLIDDVEDHEVLMAMCNLLKYSQNFLRHKEVFGNYVEPKSIILMIVLQMVNRLNKRKKKWKTRKKAYMTSATTKKYSCISTNTTFKHKWHYSIQIS